MSVAAKFVEMRKDESAGTASAFNGRLQDYLTLYNDCLDPVLKEGFARIAEEEPETGIAADCRQRINRDAVSNQLIHYRDVFKLKGKPLRIPYILYLRKGEQERALIVFPFSEDSFLYAKGAYYCLTEQNGEFEEEKNEIVAVSPSSADRLVDVFHALFTMHAGALQRRIDRHSFQTYDELKQKAERAAERLENEAMEKLPDMMERTGEIYKLVVCWFLLKKVLYVQYMTDKSLLLTVHDGSVRAQRNQARMNAEDIKFIAYSDLWRMGADADQRDMAASHA